MTDSLVATVYRLVAMYSPSMDPQMVLNHLVVRPSTGCLDSVVQDYVEGRRPWSRTGLDHRSSRFWSDYVERVA